MSTNNYNLSRVRVHTFFSIKTQSKLQLNVSNFHVYVSHWFADSIIQHDPECMPWFGTAVLGAPVNAGITTILHNCFPGFKYYKSRQVIWSFK